MESILSATLRDILCGTISLDDGLSAIQSLSRRHGNDVEYAFEIARALEEIILRRPASATAKLAELSMRLSLKEDSALPKMMVLLDTRYTNTHRRVETETLPGAEAIPILLDLLAELSHSIEISLNLNLRPLLPFLTDEIILTIESLHARNHNASTQLALNESHYLTYELVQDGHFECAEALLNKILSLSRELELSEMVFEAALSEAAVLTELGMYTQSRTLIHELNSIAKSSSDRKKLADISLQLAINENRDATVHHTTAYALADVAISLYEDAILHNQATIDDKGLAQLMIGSSILLKGSRNSLPDAIERLNRGMKIYENMAFRTTKQLEHFFKCLAGLGFANGLLSERQNMKNSADYFERAKSILRELTDRGHDCRIDEARCDNALGWLCLDSEHNDFWDIGTRAFQRAESLRSLLLDEGRINKIEALSSKLGLALSLMRTQSNQFSHSCDNVRQVLIQYTPIFSTDRRALTELAIATYDLVWLALHHGAVFPDRVFHLLEDIDRILADAQELDNDPYVDGALLIIPFLNQSWRILQQRAERVHKETDQLANVAKLMHTLSISRLNLQSIGTESIRPLADPVDGTVEDLDPLLAQYWRGQTELAQTLRLFYENRDYTDLASGLRRSAVRFDVIEDVASRFSDSAELIKAAASSLSILLLEFSKALHKQYQIPIVKTDFPDIKAHDAKKQFDFILDEEWLSLIKITSAYLQMMEDAESIRTLPYLNVVFSNISRALKIMDNVALVDRRILAFLRNETRKRVYLR